MTARVLSLDAWRYGRQIVERVPTVIPLNYPPQVRIEMARRVEHAFGSDVELIDRWARAKSVLHGSYLEKPCDV